MISFWRAVGEVKKTLAVSLSRSVVWPVVLMAALPLMFGREAIWFCHSLGEEVTAGVVGACFLYRAKNKESFWTG